MLPPAQALTLSLRRVLIRLGISVLINLTRRYTKFHTLLDFLAFESNKFQVFYEVQFHFVRQHSDI